MILTAQAANGLLLPLCAFFLLWVMNNRKLMGEWKNGFAANSLGVLVTLLTLGLGGLKIWQLF